MRRAFTRLARLPHHQCCRVGGQVLPATLRATPTDRYLAFKYFLTTDHARCRRQCRRQYTTAGCLFFHFPVSAEVDGPMASEEDVCLGTAEPFLFPDGCAGEC
ncbi:exo-alpha-sialidase [Trypanosoma cruzi]|nr:exo-alpha-sialidase [Trypanosoma cruzi]